MALLVKDRVREASTTTGTGTLTLDGAVSGFQTFLGAIGDTNTTYYAIVSGAEWEVGLGTVGAGTLSRDAVLESTNSNALVNFGAGSKDVFCTYPAERGAYQDSTSTVYAPQLAASNGIIVNSTTVSVDFVIPDNYNALTAGPITIDTGISVTLPTGSTWVVA
tara:strand:+ start:293 stop:781 length:489 start_codon:yes stop_codon:yes gene_type:complete